MPHRAVSKRTAMGPLTLLAMISLLIRCECAPPPPAGDPCVEGPAQDCPCPEGFWPRGDEASCVAVRPDQACLAGTRPSIGQPGCVSVGVGACPDWAEPDASGWGCRARVVEAICDEGSEKLGELGCVSIGDCENFPPAEATRFVDGDYASGDIDASHFSSISAALRFAPAGSTIAVEAGDYHEWINVDRNIRIIGRCAAQVHVISASAGPPGLQSVNHDEVYVEGITFEGHEGGMVVVGGGLEARKVWLKNNRSNGLVAMNGARVTLRDSRVSGSVSRTDGEMGFGVFVDSGAQVRVVGSSLVGNMANGVAVKNNGSLLHLERSLVAWTLPDDSDDFGKGAVAAFGARLEVVSSVLMANLAANLSVIQGASAEVDSSILGDAQVDRHGLHGYGIELDQGSSVMVHDSTIANNTAWALMSQDDEVHIDISESTVRGLTEGASLGGCLMLQDGPDIVLRDSALIGCGTVGLRLQGKASLGTIEASLIQGTRYVSDTTAGWGSALIVAYGAQVEATDLSVLDSQMSAVVVGGEGAHSDETSLLQAQRLLIDGSLVDRNGQFGFGLQVSDGAQLILENSEITGAHAAALVIGGIDTYADVRQSTLRRTRPDSSDPGHGLVCADDGRLMANALTVLDNQGVGLAFGRSSAIIEASVVVGNEVGVHSQSGTALREVDTVSAQPVEQQVQIDRATRFVGNGSRVGSGEIHLPDLIGVQ